VEDRSFDSINNNNNYLRASNIPKLCESRYSV
jgi:hypothetical protein